MSRDTVRVGMLLAAVFLSSCGNPERDFQAARAANSEQALEEFIRKHPTSSLAYEARESIEQKAFASARAAGTVAALESFIERFHDGPLVWQAKAQLESVGFAEATKAQDPVKWREFLRRHPQSPHAAIARDELAEALLRQLTITNRASDYEDFAREFRDTPSAANALTLAEALDYEAVLKAQDADAYARYLTKHPESGRVLTNQTVLEQIALGTGDAPLRKRAAERLTNELALTKVVLGADPWWHFPRRIIARLQDPGALARIVAGCPVWESREAALARIQDEAGLRHAAERHSNAEFRTAAADVLRARACCAQIPSPRRSTLTLKAVELIRALNDPLVKAEAGDFTLVLTHREIEQPYVYSDRVNTSTAEKRVYAGSQCGEAVHCTITFPSLSKSVSETWTSEFPNTVSARETPSPLGGQAANVQVTALLGKALNLLSSRAVQTLAAECADPNLREAAHTLRAAARGLAPP